MWRYHLMSGREFLLAVLLAPTNPTDRIHPEVPRPKVTIARVPGDPASVRIKVTNLMTRPIAFSLAERGRTVRFLLTDEGGAPKDLARRRPRGPFSVKWPKPLPPGDSRSGDLSPKMDYKMPPGRYRVSV